MADRRMFHKNVVESDAFLDMPTSAQALYFHIGMYADDDGFVNGPRRIARLIGASNEDLQLLIDNRFLLAFPNGVVVIKHWRMANSLKNDRAKMPQYPELAAGIYIKENRSYTDHPAEGAVSLLEHKQRYMESRRNPNGIPSEGKGTEGNRTEGNRAEAEAGGFQAGGDYSTELSTPEDVAAAAADRKLKIFRGELGKGVVFLSDAQIADLLEKLDLDLFDHYVDKLANFIIKNDAKVKNHYETIQKWWREDSEIGG
ncbi:MAG: hypothetical protein IJO31_09895 [Oscillospiraceae bacterium]|nr:hypothetical protein [Oscillospiraceae bacterium]